VSGILSAPAAERASEATAAQPKGQAQELVLCRYCDLLQHLPALADGEEAHCSRCGHELDARQRESALRPILYALSALFMLVLTNLFPFVGMDAAGSHRDMTFLDTSAVLLDEDYPWLAVLVWLFIQAIPALCMLAIIYLKLGMFYRLPALVQVARLLYALKPWSMVDIFLMGLLVSFVKLLTHFELSLGMSFWAFCGFCLLHLRTFQVVDRHELWSRIAPAPQPVDAAVAGATGLSQQLKVCQCCTALVPLAELRCSRCGSKVRARIPSSVQKTLALLVTASILYIPANLLTMMETVSLGDSVESTIISGILLMWADGAYPVAIVVLLASVVVPVVKIVVMFWLCYLTTLPLSERSKHGTWIYPVVDWIGRWSMVDVLVVAILAALVRFDSLVGVYPGAATLVFAAVVIVTMLAAMSFDPRLLWDLSPAEMEQQRDEQRGTGENS
jgi:paraquat-inducible protein A